ncbi:hypothetical protein D9611_009705 [Ephemerocybe angulata]|uniref:Uncharacterized protein n=1 Tax=Ephemerocybe angulata TaxID=980116 RepID=A0A8H5C5Z0_9AGAR|nr:hypothetical protein D9611_009705 [Tulosesus angulatus]
MYSDSGSESDSSADSGFTSSSGYQSSKYSPRAAPWTCDPAFGVVHQDQCSICRHYMSHFVEGSRDSLSSSFHSAVAERDGKPTMRYLEGIEEGRRIQVEKDKAKLARYREERSDAHMKRHRAEAEAKRLRAELREMRDAFMAMQVAYEEQIAALTFGPGHAGDELEALRLLELQDALFAESGANELSARAIRLALGGPSGKSAGGDSDSDASDSDSSETTSTATQVFDSSDCSCSSSGEDDSASRVGEIKLVSVEKAREIMSELTQNATEPATLGRLRELCLDAHRTPKGERSAAHRFVLKEAWKVPMVLSPRVIGAGVPLLAALPEVFVDASGKGIGFLWNGRWAAWKLSKGWRSGGRDMQWAEMVAVELGLRTLIAAGVHSTHIRVRSDNRAVVTALSSHVMRGSQEASILREVLALCKAHAIAIMPVWVWTKFNPADPLSRGEFPSWDSYVDTAIEIPIHLEQFVSNVQRRSA